MKGKKVLLGTHIVFSSFSLLFGLQITSDTTGQNISVTASIPTDKNFLIDRKNEILKTPDQNITITLTGTYYGDKDTLYGAIANSQNSQVQNFNGQTSINMIIDSTGSTGDKGSLFFTGQGGTMTFNTNLSIRFATNSNIGAGVFLSDIYKTKDPGGNDQLGTFSFNKNLIVDTTGVTGSGYIFNLNQQKAEMYVNYDKNNSGNAIGSNTIQLTGDIHLNGKDTILGINLNNSNSYILGKEDYTSGNFNLHLSKGGKWIVTANDVYINNLNIQNNGDPNNNAGLNSTDLNASMSMIDIATRKMTQGFTTPQTIHINNLSGNNGVFRIMVDLPKNQGDLITIQNKDNGAQTHYIQIFQRTADLANITNDVSLKVAEIINGGDDLTFNALPTTIGLYTYTAQISKERQDAGYRWVIYQKKTDPDNPDNPDNPDKKPAEIQDTLVRWMSLQYRIYRIQTDSINKHIDELIFTRKRHNVWANYFLGRQSYEQSKDHYQTFQSGYDWGMNSNNIRHFAGGFFDYTRMKDYDISYNGEVDSIGFGVYYQSTIFLSKKTTIDFDAKMKYTYSSIEYFGKNELANANFLDSYHLFFIGTRLGGKIGLDKKSTLFLEPSMQAGIGFMNGGFINIIDQPTQTNFGAQQDSAKITSIKTNLSFGKRFENRNNYWDIRAKTYYAYDNNTGGDITLIDVNPTDRILFNTVADHRMGIGIDANASINDTIRLYASFERTFFSNYNTDYLIYFGARISFDSDIFKNTRRKNTNNIINENNSRKTQETRRQGRIIFGENARPLPKLIIKEE